VTRIRRTPLVLTMLVALACCTWAMVTVLATPAAAIKVEDRGTAGLDGKVVMSPAAERIETVDADGGEQIGPGSVVQRFIILHNRTKEKVDFDLEVSEVVGSSAELVVEVRHGERGGAAAWVTLEDTSFSLKPGQQGTIGVKIRIPKTVKPGSKPFAVTATQRSPQVQTQGAGIAPQFKQVAIFILELPGDAPVKGEFTKATITSAQQSEAAGREGRKAPINSRFYVGPKLWKFGRTHDLRLSTEYRNSGERLLKPKGQVVVRDILGRVAQRYDVKEFTVYPDGENAGQVQLKGLPSLGIFQVKVELESEAGGGTRSSVTLPRFVIVPKWFLVVAGAFGLYVIFRLVRWQLRRRAEWRRYMADEGGEGGGDDGDDIDAEWADVDPDAWNAGDDTERV
jgi:hypothetical protein